jgi:hypothetical protein
VGEFTKNRDMSKTHKEIFGEQLIPMQTYKVLAVQESASQTDAKVEMS